MSSSNEGSDNYSRIVYVLNDIRLIRCRDDLQWITQYHRGGYWRSGSYHTEVSTIHRDEPLLDLRCVREAIASDANKRLVQLQVASGLNTSVFWAALAGLIGNIQPRRANQSYNTVMLNLIVIQHQSFDVYVVYSHSLRVPLMAGPLCLAFFCLGVGLAASIVLFV